MPTVTLSNKDLKKALQASLLSDDHKKRLLPLIGNMSDDEKNELMGLIAQAAKLEEDRIEAQKRYNEELAALNDEYLKKMDDMVRTETRNAREAFEQAAQQKEKEELSALEGQITNI